MKLRCYFRAAVLMKNRLHDELGEQIEERLHPDQQRRSHSSSNTSWWDKSGWNWKWAHKFSDFVTVGFVYSRLRSTVTDGWCGQMHLTDKNHSCTCHHIFERTLFLFCLLPFPLVPLLSLSLSTCSLFCSSTSMWSKPLRIKATALTHKEEYCTVAIHDPLRRTTRMSSPSDLMTLFLSSGQTHVCHSFLVRSFTMHAWPSQHGMPHKNNGGTGYGRDRQEKH